MLWRIAMFGGHLHPDFIRDKLTDKQLHEIAWYFERHPFGHDIDHVMLSRVVASMGGGKPEEFMPVVQSSKPQSQEDMISSFSGLGKFMRENNLESE